LTGLRRRPRRCFRRTAGRRGDCVTMERIRRRVEAVCRRFPAETAVFSRPALDAFRQPLPDGGEPIGSLECWRIPGARPDQWSAALPGQAYEDDGSIWISVVWRDDLPAWRHGDICVLDDGVRRVVRNIQNRGNVRVFIQLSEV